MRNRSPADVERRAPWRGALFGLGFVVAYVASAQLGWYFRPAPSVTMIWPPSALALALLLRRGWRASWWLVVVAEAVSISLLRAPSPSLPWLTYPLGVSCNLLAPFAAVWLLGAVGFDPAMTRIVHVLEFLSIGGAVGSAVGATIGLLANIVGFGTRYSLCATWLTWFAGNFMGVVVFAPFLLAWTERAPLDLRPARVFEAVVLFVLLTLAAIVDFGGYSAAISRSPLSSAIFPFIMWAALRFGRRGAATAHLVTCLIAVLATSRGTGPLAFGNFAERSFYLHCFTAVAVMTSLFLGAVIEERANALTTMEQKAAELKAVLVSMNDGVLVCDRDLRLTLSNPKAAALLGFDLGRSLARPDTVDLRNASGDAITPANVPLARAARGEPSNGVDLSMLPPGSSERIYLQVTAAPIVDSRGIVGAVSVARDVSERAAFERTRDEFLSVAAHELKTPVTVQKATAQALLRSGAEGAPRRYLEAIDRGADRIERVVQDMLDVSQIHMGALAVRREPVDIGALVRKVVTTFASPSAIEVVGATCVVASADADRIEQVLRCLLANALHHSPSAERIEVHVTTSALMVTVSVVDHGVGIPHDKQGRIFERFFRAHAGTKFDGGGVGVGLYICREIVRQHEGRIGFVSEPGYGSTFSFDLPRLLPQAETDGHASTSESITKVSPSDAP